MSPTNITSRLTRLSDRAMALRRELGAKRAVLLLLLPLVAFGVLNFGARAALVIGVAVATCMAASLLLRVLSGEPMRLINSGTVITALLLALTLSDTTPLYMVVVGALVAELLGKASWSPLGRNPLNPAALGRAAVALLEVVDPPEYADVLTGASPLFKETGGGLAPSFLDPLLGFTPGAIGETSALLLALIAVPMLFGRSRVAFKRDAALAMIVTVPVLVWLLPASDAIVGHAPWVMDPALYVVGSATLLTALFFATDPVTLPQTRAGLVTFGVAAGVMGVLGRLYTSIPGCEMWAILVMNLLTPLLDRGARRLGLAKALPDPERMDPVASFFDPPAGEPAAAYQRRLPTGALARMVNGEPFSVFEAVVARADREALLAALEEHGLTGCGGAHFPVARKWRAALANPAPRALLVNAQEGEPESFKDRYLVANHPLTVLEGAAIAAWALSASSVQVVLDPDHADGKRALLMALETVGPYFEQLGAQVALVDGSGQYVCGEETALIEFLEGRRGEPQVKPPYPSDRGYQGLPTVVHNVETLCWLPAVAAAGPERPESADGRAQAEVVGKVVTVTGAVARPGVYVADYGVTLADVVALAGGVEEGQQVQAYAVGGPSGGLLPPIFGKLPFDRRALAEAGAPLGTGSVRVLSMHDSLVEEVATAAAFFRASSCGRCAPCRVGTAELEARVHELSHGELVPGSRRAALRRSGEVATALRLASSCGLGKVAPTRFLSLRRYWPDLLGAQPTTAITRPQTSSRGVPT